jgi:hypothetical protein
LIPIEQQKIEENEWQEDWDDELMDGQFVQQLQHELAQSAPPGFSSATTTTTTAMSRAAG